MAKKDMKPLVEIQNFANIWVVLTLSPIFGISIWGLLDSSNSITIILISVIGLLLTISFLSLSIRTTIDETGIHVLYVQIPVVFKKTVRWNSIEEIQIKQYDGHLEFGGFNSPGVRFGKSGLVGYRTGGDMGVFIRTKDKSEILIGTHKPKSVRDTLEQLGIMK